MPNENASGNISAQGQNRLLRRDFIALSGVALATTAFAGLPEKTKALSMAMAGPFDASDFAQLIPQDKKLRPEWVQSLFARGVPTVYTKKRGELRHIGLPIGGICCGTLYLGGDGKLWLWDIFNENKNGILPRGVRWAGFGGEQATVDTQNGGNYVSPADPQSPLQQGFMLKVNGVTRSLDAQGWEEIEFRGEYPLGIVKYTDPASPLQVTLTAYSPFIPLNADDSGLPTTICEFAIHNTSAKSVTAEIGGFLENATSLFSARPGVAQRLNSVHKSNHNGGMTAVFAQFQKTPPSQEVNARPDVRVDDFEREDWRPWKVEGTAFGKGPVARKDVPAYQGDLGGEGTHVVNSHSAAPGASVEEKDRQTGTLTSAPFLLERHYLTFFIGGGANIEQVGLRLIVDGKTVRRTSGKDNNKMRPELFDVREFQGKQAVIEIYDKATGPWGHIGVGKIMQTDSPRIILPLEQEHDWGEMALVLLETGTGKADVTPATLFDAPAADSVHKNVEQKLIGGLTKTITLGPGKSQTVTFAVVWHFPNSGLGVSDAKTGNYYAKRFPTLSKLVDYIANECPRLSQDTKLWHATWYDSTLPYWFLDRTFVNTSILATSTAHRFGTGRFWGWEGIGCCEGTCTHVWHYAQAPGRIFPEIERFTREHVDFGVGFDSASGMIRYRGEGTGPAVDGQCGRILGVLREHQMSADSAFLRRVWPNVKKAMEFLMRHDTNGDGLLDGAQENTLDAAWYGEIAWISSLYAAALGACKIMATEMDDKEFAALCGQKSRQSSHAIETELFNGEYFIQKPEPGRERTLGTYETCHIDQVHGQSWAWQVGLGRILNKEKTLSALKSLYKYNFALDVGPFKNKNRPGRPYAIAGDGGLIMSTNPKELAHAYGNVQDWQFGYFNECMSGFEHQAASHMIAEGLTQDGLAVTRAIHDRYHAARRNPYNEIECSDHYSRAMASYGSFITACGYSYHGPKGHMGFAPRLSPDNFKAPFTAAQGWGTFMQKRSGKGLKAEIAVRHGKLNLKSLTLEGNFTKVTVKAGSKELPAGVTSSEGHALITFAAEAVIEAGKRLTIILS